MGRKERRAKERQERKESIRMTPDRIYELKQKTANEAVRRVQESMRIMGKMDCAMEAMYMTDFFEALGFKRVRVMVDNNRGTVEVTLLKGRIWPLTWREKAYFKKLKCWGVCYTVRRMVRGIKIWDNRNWDID